MFLSSTDDLPPSSSSSFLHLIDDHELGHQDSHLSTFSIRDYAFSNRTKNIKKSWPFSSKSLQLCLKHGLTDPLPPIQPLGSVIIIANPLPPEASSLKKPNITHVEQAIRKPEKLGIDNGLLATTSKPKIQVAIVNKNHRKKVKLGACVDSGTKQDHHSCLFAASESMALRTCPICKTFSSASNTTLNAHIDQCLSVDSGDHQPISSKPSKPRVSKPQMKVKTMVDIYASAKGCTLEDLDRRNGTKWAMVSSYSNRTVVSDNNNNPQVSNKGRKRSVLCVPIDEDAAAAAGIGPVYIDAKGQKLRILSKFSEKGSDPSSEHEDVNEKKDKRCKSFRNRVRGKKCYKYRKLAPQTRKHTLCKEIPESRRGYSEEGRGMERAETPVQGQRGVFNQRMLSKRDLSVSGNKKEAKTCMLWDQPSALSGDDPLVLRGPSNGSTDLSDTDSSPLNSHNSWRICGESQAFGRKSSVASEAKGVMRLKKARLDFLENEGEDEEDTGKWESEMTDYDDWDDNGETDKVLLSSNHSVSGEDNDNESYEETGNNNGDDAEFESMVYEQNGCETAERGTSFMEVDPIPIPGPPGSFLPSPWDMENHGNSSVITTSQVQSSQDQLDLTDRNSSESPVSNFVATETQTLITIDKRPSRFRDNDNHQSCCCQRKEKAYEDTRTFVQPPPPHHVMIQQDLGLLSKSVPAVPNPVLRLMGKDLMVINQREEEPSSLTPTTSQFLDHSKTQQQLSSPYGRNGLYFDTNTSFYNIP